MFKKQFLLISIFIATAFYGQSQTALQQALQKAWINFMANTQCKYALAGIHIVDITKQQTIFSVNENIGMAPASTQKIFTSIAVLSSLSPSYQFETIVGTDGTIHNHVLKGNLIIKGSGDPSFGSWRYSNTQNVLADIVAAIQRKGIKKITGVIYIDGSCFGINPLPGGWIWDDIGNYYGAGTWGVNFKENQYDMQLQAGKAIGLPTTIVATIPTADESIINNIKTGKAGSGDNGYIYLPPYAHVGFTEGTIPLDNKPFTISGAMPNAMQTFGTLLKEALNTNGIDVKQPITHLQQAIPPITTTILNYQSPTLDSLNYWFMKKSINLYGEAFIKKLATIENKTGTTDNGTAFVRSFYEKVGIDKEALKIIDGSGLSPQNRVTAKALTDALLYAYKQPWYSSFYNSLPEYNNMKLKSGTIGGCKSFAGYYSKPNGTTYCISILVNNFSGSASEVVKKMYTVLNELK